MSLEVPSVSFSDPFIEEETTPIAPLSPKGLSSIPDSLAPPSHPPPPFFKKTIVSFALAAAHLLFAPFYILFGAIDWIYGICIQKNLYRALGKIVEKGGDIAEFLSSAASQKTEAGFILGEFAHLPELHPYLKEILEGANICLREEGGHLFSLWKAHPQAYPRTSSHKYQKGCCFALNHLLFWLDLEGNTRFQFENNPFLRDFRGTLFHFIDYLRYIKDNRQQGVIGTSSYTESYSIDIPIDLNCYLSKKG